jgi:ribosomal protein L37AE/L43A
MKKVKTFEEYSANQVKCDECGWKWRLEEGGEDVYICHECGHDNSPEHVQEAEDKETSREALDNAAINKALDKKAKESGVPIGIIRAVMRRGMGAWNSSHHPGATQEQWGYARVNAFLEKGDGTWQKADADLAKEVRDGGHDEKLPYKVEESLNEAEETYNDYPAAAKANAKKALDWRDEYGRDEVTAGTPVGWQRANQLAKGEKLSRDVISRMAQFNRHRKNSEINPEYKSTPWKDNGYVAWLIWGGDEGVDWAIKKIKEIDEKG